MITDWKKSRISVLLFQLAHYLWMYPTYILEYHVFKNKSDSRFMLAWKHRYPSLDDRTTDHPFDFHYVYHLSWAARVVKKIKPKKHVDISSSLYFSTIVSAFIPVDFYDYRPAAISLTHLQSLRGDLMKLPFKDASVESLSCMHVVEHIGLGRYGDPLDPQGDIQAITELKRIVKKNGHLLFVTPIGVSPRIQYNSHRIYTYKMIINYFKEFTLKECAYISESHPEKGLQINPTPKIIGSDVYSTACFWFQKK